MDPFILEAIVGELQELLTRSRVDKIHQPAAEILVLRLWNGREELRLLLGVEPGRSRVHLTHRRDPNPPAPPRFCQLLRARLRRLEEVKKIEGERIVEFLCRGPDGNPCRLVLELLGTRPDLILVDEGGRIVDSLRRQESPGRDLSPGRPYQPPAAPGHFCLASGVPEVPLAARQGGAFQRWLQRELVPMSPPVARNLAAAVTAGEEPATVLDRFRRSWLAGEFRPQVGVLDGRPVLLPFDLPHLPLEQVQHFDSSSQAAEHFFGRLEEEATGSGIDADLWAALRRQRRRLAARLANLEQESARLAAAEDHRRQGELLLVNLHRIRRGMAEIIVEDIYADPPRPLAIHLDPQLSPQENAQKLFHRYGKAKSGREHLPRRLAETREELQWLEGSALALEEAATAADRAAVRAELEQAGLLPPPVGRRTARPAPVPGIRRGRTPGGYLLLWGKNNQGNDRISRHLAAPDDPWFHAKGIPGAHLVLKQEERQGEVPEADLLFAAAVAAGYSRGRQDAKVEVMVSQGRWVRRPKGARPGMVTVDRYRTVVVRPVRLEEEG